MENDGPLSNPTAMLRQIASGDQAAFKEIYTWIYKSLYQFALAHCKKQGSGRGNSSECIHQDLAQQNPSHRYSEPEGLPVHSYKKYRT